MPIVDESKQNKGVNNNTQNKQIAIDMEYLMVKSIQSTRYLEV